MSVFNNVPSNTLIPSADYIPNDDNMSLTNITITKEEVIKQIDKLKICKSPGPDKIYPRLLKEIKHVIACQLTSIFNKSIETGVVPEDWKMANVTPIFKKGDKRNPANYRPISLTSIIGKILETIIRNKMDEYLESNNLIKNSQHGFRKNRSCLTNLLEFFDGLYKSIANKMPYDVIYLDFEKAFDKVPHPHLLKKIEAHGIGGNICNWISSWLSGRLQRVVVNGYESNWSVVTSCVPQGSVLGPLLFSIYINDIDDNIHSSISKFADDTKLGGACNSKLDHSLIQSDLNRLFEWSEKWMMKFNISKCKVMHFGRSKNTPANFPKYVMNGVVLDEVQEEKDLGVIITENLKASVHCDKIAKKANKILGLIKRTFTYKDEQTILKLYKSLVRPHLEYAQQFWSPTLKKDINKLNKVQERAIKVIPTYKNLGYKDKLKKLDLFTLEKRRLRGDLIEMYKIITQSSELDFDKYFKYCQSGLRGNGLKLENCSVKSVYNRFFFSRVVKPWNALKQETVSCDSLVKFKKCLDNELRHLP